MATLKEIQKALQDAHIDGWLFADFHQRDLISYRILSLDQTGMTTRRWFYFIPAEGMPQKIVSAVEAGKLDSLEGEKHTYRSWQQLHELLRAVLAGIKRVAMQYSPKNNIPYVSTVDAGTVDLIRSFGLEVVSSASLVQQFDGLVSEASLRSHRSAGAIVHRIKDESFDLIRRSVRAQRELTEYDVAQFILQRFDQEGLTTDSVPIVGVNEHPADPHFEPTPANTYAIKMGDTVLIDLWAKLKTPSSIYYDITWCGFVGENPPARYAEIFLQVVRARDATIEYLRRKLSSGKMCYGYELDEVARRSIAEAGFGEYFIHRTGHSIGEEVHGNGVNIDNLETHDDRPIVPGALFSIEPGIYLPGEMAARTEVNVYVTSDWQVEITGPTQQALILL